MYFLAAIGLLLYFHFLAGIWDGSKIDFFLRKRTKRHTSKFFTTAFRSSNFSLLEETKENQRRHVSTRLGGARFGFYGCNWAVFVQHWFFISWLQLGCFCAELIFHFLAANVLFFVFHFLAGIGGASQSIFS